MPRPSIIHTKRRGHTLATDTRRAAHYEALASDAIAELLEVVPEAQRPGLAPRHRAGSGQGRRRGSWPCRCCGLGRQAGEAGGMSAALAIPREIADHCLRPSAHAELVRLMLRGARPDPLVLLRQLNGGWVARYAFKEAVSTADGPVDHWQSTLLVHPESAG